MSRRYDDGWTPDERAYWRRFGQRLSEARRSVGMTQERLAQTIGVSRSSIANMESGRQVVRLYDAVRLHGVVPFELPSLDVERANAVTVMAQQNRELEQRNSDLRSRIASAIRVLHTVTPAEESVPTRGY